MTMSTESLECKVFETSEEAHNFGKGGIYYAWTKDSAHRFPEDVREVRIIMPVSWGGDADIPENKGHGIEIAWNVGNMNPKLSRWTLSGTRDHPSLSPSINWVGQYHGHLTDGYLKSC